MSTGTVRFHRVLTAPPERVYRAFLDADAMAKWLPPHGFTGHVHKMDARVGGSYRMSFTNFSSGKSHAFGGTYLELVPNERLRYTATFDDPNLPGEMQTTIILRKVSVGTEIDIVQEGIPAVIPPEACCLGWQECSPCWPTRAADSRLSSGAAHAFRAQAGAEDLRRAAADFSIHGASQRRRLGIARSATRLTFT